MNRQLKKLLNVHDSKTPILHFVRMFYKWHTIWETLFLCTLVRTVQKVCKIAEDTKCENIKSSFSVFCKNQLQ